MESICQTLETDITHSGTVAKFSEKQFAEILENRKQITCTECGNPADNRWSEKYQFYILCQECGFAFKFDLETLKVRKVPIPLV